MLKATLLLTAVLSSYAFGQEEGSATCVKKVLDRFCLGAELSSLPTPLDTRDSNQLYIDGTNDVMVIGVDNRAAMVGIFYEPASWITYNNLLSQLQQVYGAGENQDSFASHANDETSRRTQIAIGQGRAQTVWRQPGWTVRLVWSNADRILLRYSHDGLEDIQQQQALKRL